MLRYGRGVTLSLAGSSLTCSRSVEAPGTLDLSTTKTDMSSSSSSHNHHRDMALAVAEELEGYFVKFLLWIV